MQILIVFLMTALILAFILSDKLREWLMRLFRPSGGNNDKRLSHYEDKYSMQDPGITPPPRGKARHSDDARKHTKKKGR